MDATPKQKDVLNGSKDLLVLGGPGSGKTTAGLLKARCRIAQGLQANQTVLFLSFSNAAVYQIQRAGRILLDAQEHRLLSVHTFHSYCWEILKSNGYLLNLHSPLSIFAPEEEAAARAGVAEWPARCQDLAKLRGIVTFDLFAPLAAELLRRSEPVRALWASCHPLVIVDEFQDTDDDQWNMLDLLTRGQQLVALADSHQRIFDFRTGVHGQRLNHFRQARQPVEVDLEDANHRSPGCDILRFAQHVLEPSRGAYSSPSVHITRYTYANQRGVTVKHAIERARKTVQQKRGAGPVSVAVLAASNAAVLDLSGWLRRTTPAANFVIDHDVFADFDEMASARNVVLAFLDTSQATPESQVVEVLGRVANFYRCKGGSVAMKEAETLARWQAEIAEGRWPRRSSFPWVVRDLVTAVRSHTWAGCPVEDCNWLVAQAEAAGNKLAEIASLCQARPPVRRKDAAYTALERIVRQRGDYSGAGVAFRRASMQERLLDRARPSHGCSLMTLHKCKGKEFDAVVIFDGMQEPHRLVLRDDPPPHDRSRRLLRVAITRARHHVTVVTPTNDSCALLPRA